MADAKFKSVHKGKVVDISVGVAGKFNELTDGENKEIIRPEEVASGTTSIIKGFKLYRKKVTVSRDDTTGALTITDTETPIKDSDDNPIVIISEKEGGDVATITSALREDYLATNHITLVGATNQVSKYAAKHIVGITPTVKTYELSAGSLKFTYRGQFTLGEVTKYLYTVKRATLPFYFTEEKDPSKITSLSSCIIFHFASTASISKINDASIVVNSKTYVRDAYNDLIVNEYGSTTYPNYFAWVNGTDYVFTDTATPSLSTLANINLTSWEAMAATPVTSTEKEHTQGVQINKGTIENKEDETLLEPIKDGLDDDAKEVDSLAKTSEVGYLDELSTVQKGSIVDAINEVEERQQVFTTTYDPLHFAKEGDVWMTTN